MSRLVSPLKPLVWCFLEGSALMWTGDQCGSLFSIHTDETDRERPPLILGKNTEDKSATNGVHLQTMANARRTI